MVPVELENLIDEMSIGEERIYDEATGKYATPDNLGEKQSHESMPLTEPSRVWQGFKMPSIGNRANAIPKTPSGGNSSASSEIRRGAGSDTAAQPSRFLPLQEQARLREWSKNVDLEADPATAAEKPMEPEAPQEEMNGATKRRVEDSDSDCELPPYVPNAALAARKVVIADSDSEDEVVRDPTRASAKEGQTQSLQQQALQALKVDRSNRRRGAEPQQMPLRAKPQPTRVVGADSFFAGVPRDENGDVDHTVEIQDARQKENVGRPPPGPSVAQREPRKRFGYDGADDDPEELDSPYIPASPLIAQDEPRPTDESISYMPSATFDPARYRAMGRGQKHQKQNHSPRIQHYRAPSSPQSLAQNEELHLNTVALRQGDHASQYLSRPSAMHQGRGNPRPVPAYPRAHRSHAPDRGFNALVDIDEDEGTEATSIKPPPGFTVRAQATAIGPDSSYILDSPLDEIQRPSIKPCGEERLYHSEETSFSASSSSGDRRQPGIQYVPQSSVIKPDVYRMRSSMLDNLKQARKSDEQFRQQVSQQIFSTEKIDSDDEASSRKFHNTMNLKTSNPGKSKKKKGKTQGAQETEAQKQARIAKTKEELMAPMKPKIKTDSKSATSSTPSNSDKLSAKGLKEARKNPQGATLHAAALQDQTRKQLSGDLVQSIKPLLEAARSFCGRLEFELQLGQLIIMPTTAINAQKKVYEVEKWYSIFGGTDSTVDVKFTNMLTNHGPDIDGILESKTQKWKTWSKDLPGPSSITFEFYCRNSLSQDFIIALYADGSYSVYKGTATIGKIGIHCPGRVWDACAVVAGLETWQDMTPEFAADIQEFASTIYVDSTLRTTVYFRPPASNLLTVQEVVLKSMSLHDCQVPDEQSLQLKITEVKTLSPGNHRTDKRLHMYKEEKHERLADKSQLHYEVAVTHKEFNNAFKENTDLELGELTFAVATSLFTAERAHLMLGSVLRLVDKVDWVGARNYGTVVQKEDALIERERQMAKSMPLTVMNPTLMRPAALPSGHSVAPPRTTVGGSTAGTAYRATPQAGVHGVRMNTTAPIYSDNDGNLFYYGLGAARVPVILDDGTGIGRQEVVPNDSASQIGGRPRVPRVLGAHSDRPDGFW